MTYSRAMEEHIDSEAVRSIWSGLDSPIRFSFLSLEFFVEKFIEISNKLPFAFSWKQVSRGKRHALLTILTPRVMVE